MGAAAVLPGASALVMPVVKPATRAAARLGSRVSRSAFVQAMSSLEAKEIETVSVVSMSRKETVPESLRV